MGYSGKHQESSGSGKQLERKAFCLLPLTNIGTGIFSADLKLIFPGLTPKIYMPPVIWLGGFSPSLQQMTSLVLLQTNAPQVPCGIFYTLENLPICVAPPSTGQEGAGSGTTKFWSRSPNPVHSYPCGLQLCGIAQFHDRTHVMS